MSGQIFLSFSREHDAGYVARLVGHLAAAGVAARYDSQLMSESWWETYTRAQVDSSSGVVVVMTPEAQQSGWVAREVGRARERGKPIVGLLLRGESFLPGVVCEDVRGGGMPGSGFVERLRGEGTRDETARGGDQRSHGGDETSRWQDGTSREGQETSRWQDETSRRREETSQAGTRREETSRVGAGRDETAHGEAGRGRDGAASAGWGRVPVRSGALASAVGLETKGGVFTPLIARGRAVPCVQTEMFTTAEDDQESIQVRVFYGDGGKVVPQQRLGHYEVRLLEREPRGVPNIHLSFELDEIGTFYLSAKDGVGREVPVVKVG